MKFFFILVIGISFLSIFYIFKKSISLKKFFICFFVLTFPIIIIYQYTGNTEVFTFSNSLKKELLDSKNIDPKKIIFFLEKELKDNPDDLTGWRLLARTCLMTGYLQKANKYYKKAIEHFPKNIDLLTEYALFKKSNNELKASIKIIKKIDTFFPKNVANLILLTELYIEDKNKIEAQKIIRVLKVNKISEEILLSLKKKIDEI